ncbi:MAG: choice-of-anchor tandem repeat GloVer-containing protein [Candidatus Sulfotelmatobacter sp.]
MRLKFLATICRIVILVPILFVPVAHAQSNGATEQVLFLFGESAPNSGDQSVTSLTWDDAGNLYGSTIAGGLYPGGIVFKMTNSNGAWGFTVLYNFGSIPDDGSYSASPLVFDANGNLYGTTQQGGAYGYGTVFELIPSQSGQWTEKQLYSFEGGNDGAYPQGSIALDSAGNIYGITSSGGSSSGFGTVFEVAPTRSGTWRERLLHKFTGGVDGEFPWGGVTFDSSGSLFGTTLGGGADTYGVVFEFVPAGSAWQERVIHSFTNAEDGSQPFGNLIFDALGNLYGTTAQDGGSVFEMTPTSSSWRFHTLYKFSGETDPSLPYDGVARDSSGNLYGTTFYGGANNLGTVFEVSPSSSGKWTMQILYSFVHTIEDETDGYYPKGGLILDSSGNLYGTTNYGGYYNSGTVFEVTP